LTQKLPIPEFSASQLAECSAAFTGALQQQPPIFSNIKVNGRRAHDIARQGETAVLKSRAVTVHSLELSRISNAAVAMRCTVSSGTYIRALARDIAVALGTCGYLTQLRRVAIGTLQVTDTPHPAGTAGTVTQTLHDEDALTMFEALQLSTTELAKFLNGVAIAPEHATPTAAISRIFGDGKFYGLGNWDGRLLRVEKIYSTQPA
jgi:tRNA U55 pseudouridine synthase TruB